MYSRNPGECLYTPETELTIRADGIAGPAHDATGKRYGRYPFIVHPRKSALLLQVADYGEVPQAIALLHDVIEDTDEAEESIQSQLLEGIEAMDKAKAEILRKQSIIVVRAVVVLSKDELETRATYLKRVREDPPAAVVKSKGDAECHVEYNEWKREERIRRASAERRIRKYTRVQEYLADKQLTPVELEEYIAAEMDKIPAQ